MNQSHFMHFADFHSKILKLLILGKVVQCLRDKNLDFSKSTKHCLVKRLTGDRFYIVPKKCRAEPKSIQTPAPSRPPAGRNPDWSITMIFMQLTTQLIHYHVLICITICYKPKENTIILLSSLRTKKRFYLNGNTLTRC